VRVPHLFPPKPSHKVLRSRLLGRGPAWAVLGLALTGFALPLVWLGRESQAQWQALQVASAAQRLERDALSQRLSTARQSLALAQAQIDAWPQLEQVPAPADALMLHRLALQQGLRVEHLKPSTMDVQGSAGGPAAPAAGSWTMQVRGTYPALIVCLEALAHTGPAWRLHQLQWSAGSRQLHRLKIALEALPASRWVLAEPVTTARVESPDPFGLPAQERTLRVQPASSQVLQARAELAPPPDPLADVPPIWRPEFDRSRGPLESVALKEATLTGTVRQGSVWLALVRIGSLIHTLAEGDYIGPDLGRVATIDEGGLDLREIRRDAQGRWQEQLRRWPVGSLP